MSATINPLLLTGNNPTGANMGNPLVMMDLMGKGKNPLLPMVSTSLSSPSTPAGNPFTTGSGGAVPSSTSPTPPAPNFPANTGPFTTTGPNLLTSPTGSPPGIASSPNQGVTTDLFGLGQMTDKDIGRLFNSLKSTYGDGMAHLILDFLKTGAGFNQQAINNLLASLQPGIERGEENIMEQFSAMGNRFGSPAALGLGDFLSQVNLNEGQLVTQMYEQSLQDFINVMMGASGDTSKRLSAGGGGLFGKILGGIGLGGAAAGGASAAISAVNPAADTAILDAIAAFAGFCWVAAELYGGWYAPETVAIRGWLENTWYMQPFVAIYRRFGKHWAAWIQKSPAARKVTRKLFDGFLKKAQTL